MSIVKFLVDRAKVGQVVVNETGDTVASRGLGSDDLDDRQEARPELSHAY